jgi:RNA polymerase sigma-70 factor (ECF subfamily)
MLNKKFSFVQSFLSIRPSVMHYISKLAPPAEVEDIVQEAYVKLCQLEKQQSEKNDNKVHHRSLLYVIAKNLALDYTKKSEVRLADGVEHEYDYKTEENNLPFENAVTHESFGHFCEVIRTMPKQCQKVFVLKKVYGFTQLEIAQELNISVKTVDNHVVNGMKRLKKYMDKSKNDGLSTSRTKVGE